MSSSLDDMRELYLAQNGDSAAVERQKKRLQMDRQPSAAASSSSWVNWSAESEFLGQPWDVTKIPLNKLEQMRRDPILAFALMFVKVPLIRAPWYVKCADPKIASAVDASLRKIYGRFVMAYCNSLDFGFSPMEKRFEYLDNPDWTYINKDNPDSDEEQVWTNKVVKPIVWKPFTALNPRRCKPHWNKSGEFNGIDFEIRGLSSPFFTSGRPWNIDANTENFGGTNRIADVPLDWALWATNEKDSVFGSYWGYPRIGYAYRFWWAYWYRFGVADRAFERWGDPPVIVYHPDDPAVMDESGNPIDYSGTALALAESSRGGANVALPSTVVTSLDERPTGFREWEITQMKTTIDFGSIGDTFRYLDIQKLRSVMVPEQALVEGEGGTSSRNVASTFGELFQESMIVVKEEIDDHLNRWVIPQFVEMNFGKDSPRAEIVTTGFEQLDMENMRSVLQLVGQQKLLTAVDERELAERMGIPVVSRKEAQKRLDDAVKEAQASQAAAKPAAQGPDSSAASGVSQTGLYYGPRELIVLPESMMGGKKEGIDQVKLDEVLTEVRGMAERVREDSQKETKIQVELKQPPEKDDSGEATIRQVIRDDEGFIKEIKTWKEPHNKQDDE